MLRLCVILLFAVIGAGMALALPTATSDVTYFPTETSNFTQADDLGFAARAPPMAAANVVIKGGVTVVQGGAFSFHRHETVVDSLGFGGDLNATNRTFDFANDTDGS
ncbi:hypothetical protein RA27_22450 [Ruegeria sp. ANG-R]|nr:hypothetical protein RA27_22450 [Ruegeria sp. ANG-R]